MICNFMIFLEYVGSRACLSASRKRPQRQTFVCRFFLFRADRPSNSSAAPCRNKKRQCLRPLSLRGSPLMGVAWPNKGYFLILGHAKALPLESLSLRNKGCKSRIYEIYTFFFYTQKAIRVLLQYSLT